MGQKKYPHFEIIRIAKKYDERRRRLVFNIKFKTQAPITPRTLAVSEAFGIGMDNEKEYVIYKDFKLMMREDDIVYLTGESGSGKSVLLKALKQQLGDDVIDIKDVELGNLKKPIIETLGRNVREAIELLSKVGLNDAFVWLRKFTELSDGQKYRYKLAKMIESGRQYWVMDEFASTLDRDTAKVVAFNVQKLARATGKAVLAATTHTDLFEDLRPSIHIHKKLEKEITAEYFPNEINKTCSLIREMRIEKGTRQDYEKLAGFHYRDAHLIIHQKIFALKRDDETAGVIVYSSPAIATSGRRKALGRKLTIREINRDLTNISRVIVHPKYRTIGLGVKLVAETLPLVGRPYVETVAVMAMYNPFFEKAGMKKIAESVPNHELVSVVEKLRAFGFNPVFLTSEKMNLRKLRKMSAQEVQQVKDILKEISGGVYRKRIMAVHQAYLTGKEFNDRMDAAGLKKLARMLRILGFLMQAKVYLFWKNPTISVRVTET